MAGFIYRERCFDNIKDNIKELDFMNNPSKKFSKKSLFVYVQF